MKKLPTVTLLGIDCVDAERLQKALDICSDKIEFAKVKLLTSLPSNDPRRVEIPHLGSVDAYSEFCILDLHTYVDTEHVLVAQYDGFILNPSAWKDEFLAYDYIGAPWHVEEWMIKKLQVPENMLGEVVVGNGGFSLRSKKFLETTSKLASQGVFAKYHPEDIAFCIWHRQEMEVAGITFASTATAAHFSTEGGIYKDAFGFHGFRWTNISKWIQENPEWNIEQTLEHPHL